jgi:hypothetical protein
MNSFQTKLGKDFSLEMVLVLVKEDNSLQLFWKTGIWNEKSTFG